MNKYFRNAGDYAALVEEFSDGRYDYKTKTYLPIVHENFPTEDEIVLVYQDSGCYDDSIDVFFQRDGKLFNVEASHCSCNGYEGCWNPSEVTWEYLLSYLTPSTSWSWTFPAEDLAALKAFAEEKLAGK